MKQTFSNLVKKLHQTDGDKFTGGFGSIRGGISNYRATNNSDCSNPGTCTGTNNSTCVNSGTCTDTTNKNPGSCSNSGVCRM